MRRLLVGLLIAVVVTGCGTSGTTGDKTLTVFAAASLKSTFTTLGKEFEKSHPGVEVAFSFGGSSDLESQIEGGAPADVFASADTATMDKLKGLALDPAVFASNTLEIVTPPGNPAGIASFADLRKSGINVVVCAPAVPCGKAAQKVEQLNGVALTPVSEEQSVTDVLGKVETGDADAGIVYVTDARSAGDRVTAVPFAEAAQVVNRYPIAVLMAAAGRDLAAAFVAFVLGDTGQQVLRDAGFGKP